MKKFLKILFASLLVFTCIACSNVQNDESDETTKTLEALNINFIKVGKADAIAILEGNSAILIDTGEDDDATRIIDFLKQNNVNLIEALIITHFDKDHVGAADKIIDQYPINNIYVPDYIGHHSEYLEFINCINNHNLELTKVTDNFEFDFGDAHFLIEPTKLFQDNNKDYENDNNHSLITTITHGQNKLLFMADAENERLKEWLDQNQNQNYDLIKMPHHGMYDKSLDALITSSNPKFAVITDSKKNSADKKTIEVLNKHKVLIFSTQNKTIRAISDGQSIDIFYE